jgi:hypothetical protein
MKIQICLFHLVVLLGCPASALAMAGNLASPELAFPKDYPEVTRSNILAVLREPDCHFIDGHFINWNTTLQYGGDTRALNSFLARLVKCADVILSVSFDEELDEDCTWTVFHGALPDPNHFSIHIHFRSKKIVLGELAVPEIKGDSQPKVENRR